MKKIYFPKNIYDALQENPKLSIAEIQKLYKCHESTAYRFKSNFDFAIKNPDKVLIHHEINKVKIENWQKINKQQEYLNLFLEIKLNNDGFDSTPDLRNKFYEEYPIYKNQTNRTFNRYFKKFRDKVNMSQYKLKIVQSSIKLQGFYTEENSDFKPAD
ncbi:hypothetical protein [Acinetobacter baumannii]|uniref:hypothetical protein n=1 Tax=Acinetobacter baumannii TaxID=470 RepID=UPI000BE3E52A|nr:hypothetical protein [Acinetobacter baumannii]